jgi:methyltransferase-like protein
MLDFIPLSYQRGFRKSGLAALDINILCHIPSDNYIFTDDSIPLSEYILDAYNQKENCMLFMNQDSSSRYSCITATYL